jgi:hypothetical protein
MTKFYSFLWLNNTPCIIFFNHSLVDGHLGWFLCLALWLVCYKDGCAGISTVFWLTFFWIYLAPVLWSYFLKSTTWIQVLFSGLSMWGKPRLKAQMPSKPDPSQIGFWNQIIPRSESNKDFLAGSKWGGNHLTIAKALSEWSTGRQWSISLCGGGSHGIVGAMVIFDL